MLFHVTATHTPEDCPGYHPEKMPEFIAAWDKMEDVADRSNVKILFSVNGAPEHVQFLLIEADSPMAIIGVLHTVPLIRDFQLTAVTHDKDMIAATKARAEKK